MTQPNQTSKEYRMGYAIGLTVAAATCGSVSIPSLDAPGKDRSDEWLEGYADGMKWVFTSIRPGLIIDPR